MSGPMMSYRHAFQKVLTFLHRPQPRDISGTIVNGLTQWLIPVARILTVLSCLLLYGLWLSVCLNVTNVMVSSNVLNWVEVRCLGRSRQVYFFSMSQETRKKLFCSFATIVHGWCEENCEHLIRNLPRHVAPVIAIFGWKINKTCMMGAPQPSWAENSFKLN